MSYLSNYNEYRIFIGFQPKYFKDLKYYRQSTQINKQMILSFLYLAKFLMDYKYRLADKYENRTIIYNNKLYIDIWCGLEQGEEKMSKFKKFIYKFCIDWKIINLFDTNLNIDQMIMELD